MNRNAIAFLLFGVVLSSLLISQGVANDQDLTAEELVQFWEWFKRQGNSHWTAFCEAMEEEWLASHNSTESETEGRFYKVELHHHSGYSDGKCDVGTIAQAAHNLGYDVVFLTDHDYGTIPKQGSGLPAIDDSVKYWKQWYPSVSNERDMQFVTELVWKGIYSLYMMLNSSIYSSQGYYREWGPTGARGSVFLNFSLYPVQFTSSRSSAFISLRIGGDDYDNQRLGFTWANGTTNLGRVVELDFGVNPWGNITTATTIRRTLNLDFEWGKWNHYNVNVTDFMIQTLPEMLAEDWTVYRTKVYCVASDSKTEFYLDDMLLYYDEPNTMGEMFAQRNVQLVCDYMTTDFKMYPAVEYSRYPYVIPHINYFKYDFTDPHDYLLWTNSTRELVEYLHDLPEGYPVQANHPSAYTPDQLPEDMYGCDLIETCRAVPLWDSLLNKYVIIGTWTTDSHTIVKSGDPCTFIYSPDDSLDNLMKNLYEGRVYTARNDYLGNLIFNTNQSNEPYRSRYAATATDGKATLYLKADNLLSGWSIHWIRNGTHILTEEINTDSIELTKMFDMTSEANYFRVEIRDADDAPVALTQPIFFV